MTIGLNITVTLYSWENETSRLLVKNVNSLQERNQRAISKSPGLKAWRRLGVSVPGGLSLWEWRGRGPDQEAPAPGWAPGIKEGLQGALRGRDGIRECEEVRLGSRNLPGYSEHSPWGWSEGRMVFCEQSPSWKLWKQLTRVCLPASLSPWNVICSGTRPIPGERKEAMGSEASKDRARHKL